MKKPEVPDVLSVRIVSAKPMPHDEVKPRLRGWFHVGTTPFAIAGGIVLVTLAKGTLATWGAAVYFATSLLLFGVSALYHRLYWSPRVKAALRRFDHANIFLLIAGTYTPLALGTLPLDKAKILLIVV